MCVFFLCLCVRDVHLYRRGGERGDRVGERRDERNGAREGERARGEGQAVRLV